jgi:hypothetical protein
MRKNKLLLVSTTSRPCDVMDVIMFVEVDFIYNLKGCAKKVIVSAKGTKKSHTTSSATDLMEKAIITQLHQEAK